MTGSDPIDPPGDSSHDSIDVHQVRRRIEAIWRLDAGRIVAALVRWTGDFQRAENAAQDALIAALEHWPTRGVPEHPTAWLLRTARNRAIDHLRREHRGDALIGDYGREIARSHTARSTPQFNDDARHDALGLLFIACHPVLSADTRCALALRTIGGFNNAALARAFLVPEATIAQRIVRGKRKLAEANIPFEIPSVAECRERLGSVREVIYLIFTEGHVASQGDDWMRPDLCHVARRMARVLAQAAADDAETQALLALIELHGARLAARMDAHGDPVLLKDQDRRKWDRGGIRRGLAALARANMLARTRSEGRNRKSDPGPDLVPGPFRLQAAIAACHATAPSFAATDWRQIAAHYATLFATTGSLAARIHEAQAAAQFDDPARVLTALDAAIDAQTLAGYVPLHAVRGDLLERCGKRAAAATAFRLAAEHSGNEAEQRLLLARAQRVGTGPDSHNGQLPG
ncbi:RNA polymerase sigma factor [Thioalkalivibrio paradoxus]|uniref:RNA polymerase subunit sigma-24 n=1 Tax=Thioalkalivibrio paradoxus ARh 1 TaxID=713585 RepID=W0DMK2_9GAMM|nr:RNA polymerase subunit sigma-24 [Thioalkalivibrio paradoxus ARh 1]